MAKYYIKRRFIGTIDNFASFAEGEPTKQEKRRAKRSKRRVESKAFEKEVDDTLNKGKAKSKEEYTQDAQKQEDKRQKRIKKRFKRAQESKARRARIKSGNAQRGDRAREVASKAGVQARKGAKYAGKGAKWAGKKAWKHKRVTGGVAAGAAVLGAGIAGAKHLMKKRKEKKELQAQNYAEGGLGAPVRDWKDRYKQQGKKGVGKRLKGLGKRAMKHKRALGIGAGVAGAAAVGHHLMKRRKRKKLEAQEGM